MASTGERIARRRQELGLTQDQLANEIGVSRSTVANWERGKHFPLRYRYKVEQVLGLDLAEGDRLPAIVEDNIDDPRVLALWAIGSIPPRSREGLIARLFELDGRRRANHTLSGIYQS